MSTHSPEPIKVKPRTDWDEKCQNCPVAGILINHMSDPKYEDKERLILFNFIKEVFENITGQKYVF